MTTPELDTEPCLQLGETQASILQDYDFGFDILPWSIFNLELAHSDDLPKIHS